MFEKNVKIEANYSCNEYEIHCTFAHNHSLDQNSFKKI